MSPATKALMNRVVLAVYRETFFAGFAGGSHHQFAGCDQNFLVRKSDRFSKLYRFVRGRKADYANRGGYYNIGTRMSSHAEHSCRSVVNSGQLGDSLFP